MESRITMKNLAQQFGVSTGTIHRALTGKSGVGEELKAKILEAAQEQGYRINTIASTLKRKKLRVIVSIPSLSEETRYYYSYVWAGYRKYVNELSDYNIEMIEAPFEMESGRQADVLKDIFHKYEGSSGIDGLLTVGPMGESSLNAIQQYSKSGIPVVFINEDNEECKRLGCVCANYLTTGQMMAEQISSQIKPEGRILLLAGDENIDAHYLVEKGFNDFIKKYKLPLKVTEIHGYNNSNEIIEKTVKALHTEEFDGICCVNARGSVLIAEIIKKHKLEGKFRIIGSDVFEENAENLKKGIFTNLIYKSPYQQAYYGAKMLLDYLIKDEQPASDKVLIDSVMVFKSTLYLYEKDFYKTEE